MSGVKGHHWRQIVNRKNKIEKQFQNNARKRRFTPLKDSSMSNSKIFQKSRQRSNDSILLSKKGRDLDTASIKDGKFDKNLQSTSHGIPVNTVLPSVLRPSEFKSTDSILLNKHHSSGLSMINQLRGQFKQFKQKIMKQLQRQQQVINKLAKEILNTFQFELQKIKTFKLQTCQACKNIAMNSKQITVSKESLYDAKTQSSPNEPDKNRQKVRQIEELKKDLNSFVKKGDSGQDGLSKKLQKAKSMKEIPVLNLQSVQSRIQNFKDIFSKIKRDMNEFDQINQHILSISPLTSPRNETQTGKSNDMKSPTKQRTQIR